MLHGVMTALLLVGVPAERQIQITSVDFATGEITLTNLGPANQPLDGFQFCTNDANELARYSSSGGFNGMTLNAGASLIIHFNNDAPGGDPQRINRIDLAGVWASPLSPDAYSLALYFPPVSFGNGFTMADHVQWSIGGVTVGQAGFRSDEAETGGVWTDRDAWINTTATTVAVELNDLSGAELHGPSDYTVVEPGGCSAACDVPSGDADVDDDCDVDISDLALVLANFGLSGTSHNQGDTNFSGDINLVDLADVLSRFGTSCQ